MRVIGTLSFPQQRFAELLYYRELKQLWGEKRALDTDLQDLPGPRGHSDNTVFPVPE